MKQKSVFIRKALNGYVVDYYAGDVRRTVDKDEDTEVFSSFHEVLSAVERHFGEHEV